MMTYKQRDPFTGKLETMTISDDKKSKKLVTLSMIDADDEAIDELGEVLLNAGLADEYQFIVSSTPVQALDPLTLIEQLQHIYNVKEDGDPHGSGITKTALFAELFDRMRTVTECTLEYMKTNEDNIKVLLQEINHLSTAKNINLHYLKSQKDSIRKVELNHKWLEDNGPKEGVKW